jgi:hypothetical protein
VGTTLAKLWLGTTWLGTKFVVVIALSISQRYIVEKKESDGVIILHGLQFG